MLNKSFALKDFGPLNYFLRIQVDFDSKGGLILRQTKYISDLLLKVNMASAKAQSTPMVSGIKVVQNWHRPL